MNNYFELDPLNLKVNFDILTLPGEHSLGWCYYECYPEIDSKYKVFGQSEYGRNMHFRVDFCHKELNRMNIYQPEWIKSYPFIESFHSFKDAEFDDPITIKTFTPDLHKIVTHTSDKFLSSTLSKMRDLYLLDPRIPTYINRYDKPSRSFNITGIFNKNFYPLVYLWSGDKNFYGDYDSICMKTIDPEDSYFKFTFGKMEDTLRALAFQGMVSLHVYELDGKLFTEDVSINVPDLVLYGIMSNLTDVEKFLSTCVKGFDKTEVLEPTGYTIIERLSLPPYPVIRFPWLQNPNTMLFDLCNKNIKIIVQDPKVIGKSLWFNNVEKLTTKEFAATGPMVGAIVTNSNTLENINDVVYSNYSKFTSLPMINKHNLSLSLFNNINKEE